MSFSFGKQTKKKAKQKDTKVLWDKFNTIKETEKKEAIECVYSQKEDERTKCDYCESPVQVTEYGFLSCTNKSCGILFKDYLDRSAEWRYYGSNDTSSGDPTRCGMPISDLLEKSSEFR